MPDSSAATPTIRKGGMNGQSGILCHRFRRHGTARYYNWRNGKHSFVANDVKQWEDWGIDYLKYDWTPNQALLREGDD